MEVIRSIQQLDRLRDDWNDLADQAERPLLRHEWFACCATVFHREQDLRVVVVRLGGRLAAVAPLAVAWEHGSPHLVLLGSATLHEPSGFLFRDRQALQTLLADVLRLGMPLHLQRLEAKSELTDELRNIARGRATHFERQTARSFVVPIRTDWTRYCQTLSTRITKNLSRVRARAEKLGPVTVECLSPTTDNVDGIMDVVMGVEASGWKGRRGTAMAVKGCLGDFFRLYTRAAARDRVLRVSLLKVAGSVAAVEVDIDAYRRRWQLKIGYTESLAQYYPGLLLLRETMRSAFDQGLEAFEFLGSAEVWEERWNPEAREYVTALVYPRTARGIWGLVLDVCGVAIRRIARTLHRHPSAVAR